MTKSTTVASKAFVAVVAAAMVFSLVAPAAKAATAEELQAQITALMAQIAALSGGTTTTTTTTTSTGAYTFTRSLTLGSTGADVTALQNHLIKNGYAIAAGATGYFGAQTKAAVAAWQTAVGIMPAAGYFGPVSQAKYMSMMASTPTTPTTPGTTTTTTTTTSTLKGEASLKNVEIDNGDDKNNVEEGSEEAMVADVNVEFSDGDAKITRLDIALKPSNTPTEDKPYKVFDKVSLFVDGKMVGEMDASDKDAYLDEDLGTIRFSGLNVVAKEDEEMTFTVAVDVSSSVDGAGTDAGWTVQVDALRYEDAEAVVTTDSDTEDLDGVAKATFSIDQVGSGDDLNLEDSDENPDATTLNLSENDNTDADIFAFDLSADDSDTDIVLDNLVSVVVTVATTSTSSNLDTLVNDFTLTIGGKKFSAESYSGTGNTATIDFDINGDVTIDANDTVTAVLSADFNDMDTLDEGSTIFASVATAAIDAEGDASSETVTVDGSTITGNTHTLRTKGVAVEYVSSTVTADENNDTTTADNAADYALKFEVTSFGDTVYLPFGASRTTALGDGVEYSIIDTNTNLVVATGTANQDVTTAGGSTVIKTNSFKVGGSAVAFTLNVNFDPITAGSYKVRVNKINFAPSDSATALTSQNVSAQNIESGSIIISQ